MKLQETRLHRLASSPMDRTFLRIVQNQQKVEAILAGERGFNQAGDVLTQTLDGVDLNTLWNEFIRSLQMWNEQRDVFINLLTFRVTNLIERVFVPATTQEDFEEATEFGVPKGIRVNTTSQTMGYSFKWYDLAIRYTWMFLAENNAAQVRALNNEAMEADNRLMYTRVMRRLFNPTDETAFINDQNVNVYPLYNGDGIVPPRWKNTTFDGTHTHYLTSGAATVVSGDLDDMATHLTHHGYTRERGYKFILIVNAQEGNVIRTFLRTNGDKWDFIPGPNYGGGVILPAAQIIQGQPAMDTGPTDERIGTYGPWQIIEDDGVDPGYMVGYVSGGQDNIGNIIGIREHSNSGLQGMRLVKGPSADYPLVDSYYQHGLGTGTRHRGAGVVMQVTANASYTTPAEYA